MAVSGEIEYERIERPQILTGSEGIVELKTTMAPIGVQLFNSTGVTLRLATTYIKQHGIFSVDVGTPLVPKRDDAWITDFSLEYRLPRRLGAVSVGARNIFDNLIDLLEVDPLNPRVATRRFVFRRIRLAF